MGRKGTMTDHTIDSHYLDETLTLKIFKPETFSPLYKYHICIMQDGDDYMQLGRIATLSDRFHSDQTIENTIFVGIHYNDKYDRREKYHPEGKKFTAYMKFLANEVVPLLDEELPTYHMGGSRALMGDSLGGTMALMTALKYPNTFGKVIMQSPYVDETVLEEAKTSSALSSMVIYHTIGNEETEVSTTDGKIQDFLTPNRKLQEILEEKCQQYTYHELDGEHTWKYWQKDLKRALPAMFGSENP
ncbi:MULTISPECIES: alpha/beta hydrolase [Pontibacillus]|uniref:Alpha/beta hydrolase-fold protein n=1 Tax=Pontibacillus chungwhensis TaxID=265426 RepID=A0ABY8V373_9BACI|nr:MULTISPECIES: alpha/beta hydrolase-fold protein [Pontibacillus]MCD5324650.1 esterase family protein [Pontibacillus sp. HN14]WIF99055.1 alpha/beta hydrolase-fold protein [Pontibacillus chungwhensis]